MPRSESRTSDDPACRSRPTAQDSGELGPPRPDSHPRLTNAHADSARAPVDVPMLTACTGALTRKAMRRCGFRIRSLATHADVDRFEDAVLGATAMANWYPFCIGVRSAQLAAASGQSGRANPWVIGVTVAWARGRRAIAVSVKSQVTVSVGATRVMPVLDVVAGIEATIGLREQANG
ncbi:hypothetical protein ACLMAJ_22180 [Nocardia sp. KC 131]|uniref:hypothetical protein n=1 Tax=Nocardia arseniciresistens TaxID=3392119 RepID=UPI00398E8F54